MNSSIRTLLNFLVERGYDRDAINPKVLTRPSVKDFHNIIEFLFKQLDPNFCFADRFEDEVVTMFKHLGYPVPISKSNISAVGSPHAWPSIMAAIMWLCELLNYDDACVANPAADDTEDLSDKAFYAYLAESYGLFLQGDDEQHSVLEQEFQDALIRKNTALTDQTEQLESDNHDLRNDIRTAENRRAELPELEEKKTAYISDLARFNALIEELEKYKSGLHQKTQHRETELQRLTSAVAAVKGEINLLTKKVHSQELSADDVEKLVAERERLEEQQQNASEARQAIQTKNWESEMKLRDSVQALQASVNAYNSIAEDLKLVPANARNARGKDLELVIDTRAKSGSGLLKTNITEDIVPYLASLQEDLELTIQRLHDDAVKQQDLQYEMERNRVELEEQKESTQNKIRKAEETYEREKNALDEALTLNSNEVDEMEKRLLQLKDTVHEESRAAAASRKINEIKASTNTLKVEHENAKKNIITAVMEVVSSCAAHRELIRTKLDTIKGKHVAHLQQQLDTINKFSNFEMNSILPPRPPNV